MKKDDFIISNGIGDDWFNRCYATSTGFFQTFYSSLQFIFHFDSLNWVVIELLFITPIFFRLYGFGVQQKLTKFYNQARIQLITFLFYFSFITVLSCILQYLLPRSPACLKWDGLNLSPLRSDYSSPSVIIMLTAILFLMFFTPSQQRWSIITVTVFLFFLLATISSILCGCNSIYQALCSLCIGFWAFFIFNFLPLIFIPIFSAAIAIFALFLFIPVLFKGGDASDISCATTGMRAFFLLIVTMFLFFEYVYSIDHFDWFEIKWRGVKITPSQEDSVAIIPGVLKVTEEDRFGRKLKRDIISSAVAFIIVLCCNCMSVLLLKYTFYD